MNPAPKSIGFPIPILRVALTLTFCALAQRFFSHGWLTLSLAVIFTFSAWMEKFHLGPETPPEPRGPIKPFQRGRFWTMGALLFYLLALTLTLFVFSGPFEVWEVFKSNGQHGWWWTAVVAAPLYEEIYFRGALLDHQKRAVDAFCESSKHFWVCYFNALVFWLFHAPWKVEVWVQALSQGGIPIGPGAFLLGFYLAHQKMLGAKLWECVCVHALANLFGDLFQLWPLPSGFFSLFYS